ncbi:winged helix-turn-helix transcriptional regulator [Sphingobacterium sp. MYb382]|uniref:winged helix-turn-helix transcriptional regulator n=1 Tax=Sphingobacterium sp. MYb382 TaxID=2745278 RepID=UPI0030A087FB
MVAYEKKLPTVLNNGLGLFFEVMSGKWKAMILFYIELGNTRPSELQRKIPDADRRVLDQQLMELVNHGLLNKIDFKTKPPKVVYELTELGKTILPILCHINDWGDEYNDKLDAYKSK